jgi:hypothetical protein
MLHDAETDALGAVSGSARVTRHDARLCTTGLAVLHCLAVKDGFADARARALGNKEEKNVSVEFGKKTGMGGCVKMDGLDADADVALRSRDPVCAVARFDAWGDRTSHVHSKRVSKQTRRSATPTERASSPRERDRAVHARRFEGTRPGTGPFRRRNTEPARRGPTLRETHRFVTTRDARLASRAHEVHDTEAVVATTRVCHARDIRKASKKKDDTPVAAAIASSRLPRQGHGGGHYVWCVDRSGHEVPWGRHRTERSGVWGGGGWVKDKFAR